MEVRVDFDLCESNGICEGIAPNVFRVNDNDELDILQVHPDPAEHAAVRQAVASCPKGAISVVE